MKKNVPRLHAYNQHRLFALIRIVLFLALITVATPVTMQAQNSVATDPKNVLDYIPDPNFRAYIASRMTGDQSWDTNGDGILSPREAAQVTVIDVTGMNIKSLAGIEHFTSLSTLWCKENRLTTLDISNLRRLEVFNCNYNPLETLYVWWPEGLDGKPKAHFVMFLFPVPLQVLQAKTL